MGHKVNPHGLRVGVIKKWDSNWFARKGQMGDLIVEDYNIRKYLKNKLFAAGLSNTEIERDAKGDVRVRLHVAKPGMVIGRGGEEIGNLEKELKKLTGGKNVKVAIDPIKNADVNAQLVAENVAGQIERRSSFRRAMKQAIQRAMRLGAKGIKVTIGGRLNGADIARSESYHEGTIPLHTLRADIDYGFAEAKTTYGRIGVKVWIYKGEVLSKVKRTEGGNR
ncbi:MAG: 30S ribosomal protein S3 [Oscillospiraceae bacterium]|jgi:small subunit ribosomal protein S3|nr:30S ribosomal protein S3 [Oscillospiraceae bacterium]MBQ5341170.1 30S ribosomal protein S3 [Oscillospiraceae bacterium]MBR4827856.1 30S ribosomal protein S3 [Oscillospiraceae bacterium]MBR5064658.1 30S ribosomal protein S3 [Oscillospiraceae bacterium]